MPACHSKIFLPAFFLPYLPNKQLLCVLLQTYRKYFEAKKGITQRLFSYTLRSPCMYICRLTPRYSCKTACCRRCSQVIVMLLFLLIFQSVFVFLRFLLLRSEVMVSRTLLICCLFSCLSRLVLFLLCDIQSHQLQSQV